jgi:hypothetical protein
MAADERRRAASGMRGSFILAAMCNFPLYFNWEFDWLRIWGTKVVVV